MPRGWSRRGRSEGVEWEGRMKGGIESIEAEGEESEVENERGG